MKKLLFLLVFMGLAVAVFYSCKKDGLNSQQPNEQNTYSAEEMSIWRNLTEFNKKIKSGVRDEEYITPDSAMWYLETLFNVQQATDTTFNEYKTYKLTYSLNVNNDGNVSMSDVISTYNQMVADLDVQLDNIDADYKYFIIGDLTSEATRDDSYTMVLTSGFGINPLALYEEFTSDDNWRYGNKKGKCTNTVYDSDGGIELARRFNNSYMVSSGNAWINPQITPLLSNANFPGRIYYESGPLTPPCMEYTELQYYLVQGHYIIYNSTSDSPSGANIYNKQFKAMSLWTSSDDSTIITHVYWHKYQITYADHVTLPPIGD